MSAETLRRAAALMRGRAEAAAAGPWRAIPARDGLPAIVAAAAVLADVDESTADAEHIASWHPAVALAVADLLDYLAPLADGPWGPDSTIDRAVRIAETYLGGHP